jgi:hypothetical protein
LLAPTWGQVAKLNAKDATESGDFGVSVTLQGNSVAVGAHGGLSDNGALYIYSLSGILL